MNKCVHYMRSLLSAPGPAAVAQMASFGFGSLKSFRAASRAPGHHGAGPSLVADAQELQEGMWPNAPPLMSLTGGSLQMPAVGAGAKGAYGWIG